MIILSLTYIRGSLYSATAYNIETDKQPVVVARCDYRAFVLSFPCNEWEVCYYKLSDINTYHWLFQAAISQLSL